MQGNYVGVISTDSSYSSLLLLLLLFLLFLFLPLFGFEIIYNECSKSRCLGLFWVWGTIYLYGLWIAAADSYQSKSSFFFFPSVVLYQNIHNVCAQSSVIKSHSTEEYTTYTPFYMHRSPWFHCLTFRLDSIERSQGFQRRVIRLTWSRKTVSMRLVGKVLSSNRDTLWIFDVRKQKALLRTGLNLLDLLAHF